MENTSFWLFYWHGSNPYKYIWIAGKPLKFKDMIEVKFTLLDKADAQNDGQKLIAKEERYKVFRRYYGS